MFLNTNILKKSCFYRTLWRKRAEKGPIRRCTHSCPGSYNREDPSSGPSGATCSETTTLTVTPSCRSWSQICPLVHPPGATLYAPIIICRLKSSKRPKNGSNLQVHEMQRDPLVIRKQCILKRGTTRRGSSHSIVTNQARSQVMAFTPKMHIFYFLCKTSQQIYKWHLFKNVSFFSRC